jgi:hypothetical protein
MKATMLLVWLAAGAGCSAMSTHQATQPQAPIGCCCTYGDCREKFTQQNCVSEGEFQGWTYAWHPGPCTKDDTYPARDPH